MPATKILMELKPAFDGFAGIPVETRLLFSSLQQLSGDVWNVDGMLQVATLPRSKRKPSKALDSAHADKIYENARVLGFFADAQPMHGAARIRRILENFLFVRKTLWRAHQEKPLSLNSFDARAFENFIWTALFEKTLLRNDYDDVVNASYKLLTTPKDHMYLAGMRGLTQFHRGKYLNVDTTGYEYFLAQTPFPGRVTKGTKLLVRYHDAVPIFMPHTIENQADHLDAHYFALKQNIADGGEIICVSEATRQSLLSVIPEAEDCSHVIHNMAQGCFHSAPAPAENVWRILRNRMAALESAIATKSLAHDEENAAVGQAPSYLFAVSTLEPRKNYETLIRAWEQLKQNSATPLRLVIAGGNGWKSEPLSAIIDPWEQRGEIIRLSGVPAEELRVLYQHAVLTVCPSYQEGFGYAGVEAMRSGGVVIASDIDVHREIYGDGAAYFDPYDKQSLVELVRALLGADSQRDALREAGAKISKRYDREYLQEQWRALLERLSSNRSS